MEDFEQLGEELGRGNYGTVMRVIYKPKNLEMAMKVRIIPTTPLSV